jgi:hypothetical protein
LIWLFFAMPSFSALIGGGVTRRLSTVEVTTWEDLETQCEAGGAVVSLAVSFPVDSYQSCFDEPLGWASSTGHTCIEYSTRSLCTTDGGYGSGWVSSYGVFQDYAVGNIDATQACCVCGGGSVVAREILVSAGKTCVIQGNGKILDAGGGGRIFKVTGTGSSLQVHNLALINGAASGVSKFAIRLNRCCSTAHFLRKELSQIFAPIPGGMGHATTFIFRRIFRNTPPIATELGAECKFGC